MFNISGEAFQLKFWKSKTPNPTAEVCYPVQVAGWGAYRPLTVWLTYSATVVSTLRHVALTQAGVEKSTRALARSRTNVNGSS